MSEPSMTTDGRFEALEARCRRLEEIVEMMGWVLGDDPAPKPTGASVVPIESLAPYDPASGPPSWVTHATGATVGTASSREEFNEQVEEYRAYLRTRGGPHAIADPGVDG
jgi:hypothetical protein